MTIRVAFVVTGLGLGGAEMMLLNLLARLDRSKFEPLVISLADGGALKGRFEDHCGTVISLGMVPHVVSMRALWRLASSLRKFGPDIIQGWMLHGNLAGLLARIAVVGRPALLWGMRHAVYDLNFEKPATARLIRLSARLSRYPQSIIYNSHTARAQHEALGFSSLRGTVIANGFDITAFAPSRAANLSLRSELGLTEDARLIGIVGRFHPMKDHRNFIKAAVRVRERYPMCRFVMIGPGITGENEELAACLKEAGVADATFLLGSREDISRVNSALDVAVSSSFTESFPNAIGEAMSCGVPCVVTNVGDSALLVGKTGVVTPPRDPEGLASGIGKLLDLSEQDRQALGAAARARVIAEFSLEKIVASYSALYSAMFQEIHA